MPRLLLLYCGRFPSQFHVGSPLLRRNSRVREALRMLLVTENIVHPLPLLQS